MSNVLALQMYHLMVSVLMGVLATGVIASNSARYD